MSQANWMRKAEALAKVQWNLAAPVKQSQRLPEGVEHRYYVHGTAITGFLRGYMPGQKSTESPT